MRIGTSIKINVKLEDDNGIWEGKDIKEMEIEEKKHFLKRHVEERVKKQSKIYSNIMEKAKSGDDLGIELGGVRHSFADVLFARNNDYFFEKREKIIKIEETDGYLDKKEFEIVDTAGRTKIKNNTESDLKNPEVISPIYIVNAEGEKTLCFPEEIFKIGGFSKRIRLGYSEGGWETVKETEREIGDLGDIGV